MPQFIPFYFVQELASAILAIMLLTLLFSTYVLPKLTVIEAVRRYLVSL